MTRNLVDANTVRLLDAMKTSSHQPPCCPLPPHPALSPVYVLSVAQTSKSAVSQVSKPADLTHTRHAANFQPCRLGSRRYSRFGNLRYELEATPALTVSCTGGEVRVRGQRANAGLTVSEAFTLLELLVTIGIIALLSAMLFPAIARAKGRAKTESCKNNLRQMGKALAMYEGDFRYYPGAGDCAVATNQWPYLLRSTNSWVVRISPYLGTDPLIFSCPEYDAPVFRADLTEK